MKTETKICEHCQSRVTAYVYNFDVIDALLLLAMGRAARERKRSGLEFTIANQVHVPTMEESLSVKCRTTQCSKLGLVAKLLVDGRQVPGVWVVTARGWAALRGETVPRQVKVRNGEIVERSDETVTIGEALRTNLAAAEAAKDRGRRPKGDYREAAKTYKPEEWFEMVEGGTIAASVERTLPLFA